MGPLGVVFDTNVFVSGAGFGGPPSRAIRSTAPPTVDVFTSEPILDEYWRVMTYDRLPFEQAERAEIITAFKTVTDATVVDPNCSLSVVEDDPDDDKFFECAYAVDADYLVSGNKDHVLPVDEYRGTSVVSPAEFLTVVDSPVD